jgi:hypothetical protein
MSQNIHIMVLLTYRFHHSQHSDISRIDFLIITSPFCLRI